MIDVAANPSDAVENALNLYGDDILRLAFSYMKSREDAEDVLQDVLLKFMQSAAKFEEEKMMKSWLFKVTANLCRDKLKSSKRKREVAIPEGFDVAAPEERPEDESGVLQAVMRLPEKYRSVIHLYYMEEYSTREIAEIMGKKESTVRSLLKRGRDRLETIYRRTESAYGASEYNERSGWR